MRSCINCVADWGVGLQKLRGAIADSRKWGSPLVWGMCRYRVTVGLGGVNWIQLAQNGLL
jgi:hypothetical protein